MKMNSKDLQKQIRDEELYERLNFTGARKDDDDEFLPFRGLIKKIA